MSVDLVWIVGGPGDREDLRYSIRSFSANLGMPWRDMWVVGDPPGWFCGARMPLVPKPGKFANQRASITAYVNHPDAAERFVLLNDDMYLTEPVEVLPVCRNLSRLAAWSQPHRVHLGRHPVDCWNCAIITTGDWTAEQTGTDPYLYECHTPLVFDTARLRDAINAYPVGRAFAVGELYPIAGVGGDGEHCGNAKCGREGSFARKLAAPMPYLSSSPDTWPGCVGVHVKGLFPVPSRFERDVVREAA